MKFIKALLLTVVILGAIGSSVAQKKSTLMGDIVIGELAARDEATREVTIKYPGKEGPEIFSGILAEGYKFGSETVAFGSLVKSCPVCTSECSTRVATRR